jgi:RecB family endonuclease NucS
VPFTAVRLIVARCEVRYSGRLDALLPEALRLLKSGRQPDGPR